MLPERAAGPAAAYTKGYKAESRILSKKRIVMLEVLLIFFALLACGNPPEAFISHSLAPLFVGRAL